MPASPTSLADNAAARQRAIAAPSCARRFRDVGRPQRDLVRYSACACGIGFVGLGTMGEPIANNLRKAGHDLTVWNRTPSKGGPHRLEGGKLAQPSRSAPPAGPRLDLRRGREGARRGARRPGRRAGRLATGTCSWTCARRGCARRARWRSACRARRPFVVCPILGSSPRPSRRSSCSSPAAPVARERAGAAALHAVSSRVFELDDPVQAALIEAVRERDRRRHDHRLRRGARARGLGGLPVPASSRCSRRRPFHSPSTS